MRKTWSLGDMADQISEPSGDPIQSVARRLGHYVMTPKFPDNVFTDPVGRPVSRLRAHVAALAFAFGWDRSGIPWIGDVYVGRDAVIAFCNNTGTILLAGIDAPEVQSGRRQSSPPECPDGQWLGAIAILRYVLDFKQGRVTGDQATEAFGSSFRHDLRWWWHCARPHAVEVAEGHPDRAAQLDALDAELAAVDARNVAHKAAKDAEWARRKEEWGARARPEAAPPAVPPEPPRPVSEKEWLDWVERYRAEIAAAGQSLSQKRAEDAARAKFGSRITRNKVREAFKEKGRGRPRKNAT
jgi:hypothetical protein